ncbi:MAG TPA: glycosyltransferase family 4 protein [Candidatus Krumholzibacteria bacterium]|nr:glycosyltransferase family 4 protein [Candidatus Krumholzibacteria bacterium]
MMESSACLKVAYVLKRFPRFSETFILTEILELERRGVEVVVYSWLKPGEGRFHAQTSQLQAKVHYLDELDPYLWHEWLTAQWPVLGPRVERFWEILRDSLERGDSGRLPEILWGAWLGAEVLREGVQHIHSHFGTMSSTVAWFASRVSGVPFSFTAHAKDIFAYSMSDHRLREKLAAASRVITVTRFNRRHLLQQGSGLDPAAVRVIYNGIDLDSFALDPGRVRQSNLILSVGRLIPKKGFDDLLDACALLKQRGVDFHCLVVGEGPDEPTLLQKRFFLGLEREVEFCGAKPQHEVAKLMQRATLLALACKDGPENDRDALPTVLLEALACSLPVVSTDFSGIPEIVDSGVDGLLVPPGDADALADGIERLLASPELRLRFAKAGRDKAERRFDVRHNAGELLDVFLDCARRRPAALRTNERGRRVLVLCADRGLPFGGTKGGSVHLQEFSEALQAAGWSPTLVVAGRDTGSTHVPEYPVLTLPRRSGNGNGGTESREAQGFHIQAVQRLLGDLHRTRGFDFVYERYSLFSTGGRMLAQKLGIPHVLEVNAPLIDEATEFRQLEDIELARDVERYLFSTTDHVIVVSSELRDYVLRVAPAAPVSVIPNGVRLEPFEAGERADAWRERLWVAGAEEFLVGFMGRVRPWHGVELLIDAVAGLGPEAGVSLCVVGADREVGPGLTQRARERGLDGRFRCLEPVPHDVAPQVLQAMDVLVAPYPQLERFYFSPLKVFEYMAAGKPIVASAIGQVRRILVDEHTALLVPPGDSRALGAALLRLQADPALGTRLGSAAHAAAREHTWAKRMESVGAILESLRPGAEKLRPGAESVKRAETGAGTGAERPAGTPMETYATDPL